MGNSMCVQQRFCSHKSVPVPVLQLGSFKGGENHSEEWGPTGGLGT